MSTPGLPVDCTLAEPPGCCTTPPPEGFTMFVKKSCCGDDPAGYWAYDFDTASAGPAHGWQFLDCLAGSPICARVSAVTQNISGSPNPPADLFDPSVPSGTAESYGCCASPTPCADCTGTQPSAIGTGLSSGTWPYAGFNPGPCIWSWFRIDIGGSITVIYTGGSFYVSAPGIDGGAAQPLSCIGGVLTGVATTGGNTVTFG